MIVYINPGLQLITQSLYAVELATYFLKLRNNFGEVGALSILNKLTVGKNKDITVLIYQIKRILK